MLPKRYDHLLRLVLVGETGVGKTCLLCRFATDDFIESHISTIGIDFKMKLIDLDGNLVKVQIWDTAGQERFEAITKQYYRRAQGIMLVFDICNRRSFEAVPRWLTYVRQFCNEDIVVTLIGNKSDKHDRRQVSFIEAQTFADDNRIDFYEVSAKDRNNVDKVCRIIWAAHISDILKDTIGLDKCGYQPFIDMCRGVLKAILSENQTEKAETSVTIENQSQTSLNTSEMNNILDTQEKQEGNWCCSIS